MTQWKTFAVICFALLGCSMAQGQSAVVGTVTGMVIDASTTRPLARASVQFVGTSLGAATDGTGRFTIRDVPVGTYRLRASMVGYMPLVKTDVVVSAARPTETSFALSQDVIRLDAVTSRPVAFSKPPDAPMSAYEQSAEEIRRLPGGLQDVVRAVSVLPGVQQVDQGRNDLVVRGGAPSENLFLVDNVEIPNINHYGSQGFTGGMLSYINLDLIRDTSFSTGGFGVRYGDKLSSVLTINLREGRQDRVGGKATLSATQFGLSVEGPCGRGGSFLVSARRSYLDWILKAAGFSFVPEYWDFLGKADYRLGPADDLSILGIAVPDKVKMFNDTADDRFENSRQFLNDQSRAVAAISWQHRFAQGFSRITLGQTNAIFHDLQRDSLLVPVFRNDAHEFESSLRAEVLFKVSKTTVLSGGVQGRRVDFGADMLIPPMTTSYGQHLEVDAGYHATAYKGAAYLQVGETLSRLSITLGGRGDYFGLIQDKFAIAPRASATYALSGTTNLTASAGRYHQSPSYVWLVANPENRRLSLVRADHLVLGLEQTLRADTRISLETYVKSYSRYPASLTQPFLVLANTGVGFGGREEGFVSFGLDPLVSEGRGWTRGVELLVQKKLSEIPLYGTTGISYSMVRFRARDGVLRPGSSDQRWILNIGGGYVLNERWEVTAKWRFATGIPYTPFNQDGTQSAGLFNSQRLGANHSLDVRADRRWNLRNRAVVAFIDIQNIYDMKIKEPPEYNERERRVEWEHPLGILPSLGLSLEF